MPEVFTPETLEAALHVTDEELAEAMQSALLNLSIRVGNQRFITIGHLGPRVKRMNQADLLTRVRRLYPAFRVDLRESPSAPDQLVFGPKG